jgi:hypothetical protein
VGGLISDGSQQLEKRREEHMEELGLVRMFFSMRIGGINHKGHGYHGQVR